MRAPGIGGRCRAGEVARALCRGCGLGFPLNVSALLDGIQTHTIYDISAKTYNYRFALHAGEMLFPRSAWTIYHEYMDAYLIVWNGERAPAAIRYSVAHELGHILLNHERGWPTDPSPGKQKKEAEANAFARCLLAPPEQVALLASAGPLSPGLIAHHFGIPAHIARRVQANYEHMPETGGLIPILSEGVTIHAEDSCCKARRTIEQYCMYCD